MTIRACKVCGLFYPKEPVALRKALTGLFEGVSPPGGVSGDIRGIIAPHAGYRYSGPTAAAAYGLLRGTSYDVVVVVAPSHHEYFDGASVYAGDAYATPLGVVPVDRALRDRVLAESALLRASCEGHTGEHAIEVQLPLLQHVLPEFSLLPVVLGDQRSAYCYELGRVLGAALKGQNALLVASTDLSHYHPSASARRLDQVAIDDIARFDATGLMNHLEQGTTEACGGGPVVAVMTALRTLGADRMAVLHHCNSGDITGDHAGVVGYVSAAALS
jgi:AmmeMemoRadiSam system protein B